MNIGKFSCALILACICNSVLSAKILAAIPSPFYSHQATFRPLWRELAKRGHELTLITTNLMEQNENITQIDFGGMFTLFEKHEIDKWIKEDGFNNMFAVIAKLIDMMEDHFKYQLTHPELIKLIEGNEKFDLVISELLTPTTILSFKFNCPLISVTTLDAAFLVHSFLGNSEHPAIYPHADLGFVQELSFRERLISTAFNTIIHMLIPTVFRPLGDKFVRKYLGDDHPSIMEIQRNASLVFINANPIFFPNRPITPKTINLGGGLHLTDPKKLPQDLQEYLDASNSGCIYFSFGSTVNSNYLTPETVEIFRKTFEELHPVRILWKFENATLLNKPENVLIRKWFPQLDILRHPNVKGFITQGGLQSMEEAIDSSVPMLAIPFFGDQINNAKKMALKQFGVQLDNKNITKKILKDSLLEILNNPLYKKNIETLSRISRDRPMSPLEEAVWWTEYVLRHGSTEHLESPSAKIPLYQYFFFDILSFFVVIIIFFILIIYNLIKFIKFILRITLNRKVKIN